MRIYVTGSNKCGEAYLIISQGDEEETVNLTGCFSSDINLSKFGPGPISISLFYEDAGEATLTINTSLQENLGDESTQK